MWFEAEGFWLLGKHTRCGDGFHISVVGVNVSGIFGEDLDRRLCCDTDGAATRRLHLDLPDSALEGILLRVARLELVIV